MPVWLIGVTTGYFIFKYKDKDFPIEKVSYIVLPEKLFVFVLLLFLHKIFQYCFSEFEKYFMGFIISHTKWNRLRSSFPLKT